MDTCTIGRGLSEPSARGSHRERREGGAVTTRKMIREAHNKGKPNKLDSVEVWGVQYRSVYTAWLALETALTLSS